MLLDLVAVLDVQVLLDISPAATQVLKRDSFVLIFLGDDDVVQTQIAIDETFLVDFLQKI